MPTKKNPVRSFKFFALFLGFSLLGLATARSASSDSDPNQGRQLERRDALEQTVHVAVWDRYFDPTFPEFQLPQNGKLSASMYLDPDAAKNETNLHGRWVSDVITQDQPFVVLHPIYGLFPWQDPEICLLVDEPAFQGKLPSCRKQAEEGMSKVSQFLRENHVKIVNMSHGTYFDTYMQHNPQILKDRYRDIPFPKIRETLKRNFDAIGEVFEPVVRGNPDVLFVVAAGTGHEGDIDSTPSWYGNLSKKFDNLIAVTSTTDGERIEETVDIGAISVDYAVQVGQILVPGLDGKGMPFTGSSGAAAMNSRLFAKALHLLNGASVSPALIKRTARGTVTTGRLFYERVATSGVFNEAAFLKALESANAGH